MEHKTTKEKLIGMMDALIGFVERIASNENAKPEEIAALPAIVNCITHLTSYAAFSDCN